MDTILVQASARTVLKQIAENVKFRLFATALLDDCAITYKLFGNALEGYEFEIKDSVIRQIDEVIAELSAKAAKL